MTDSISLTVTANVVGVIELKNVLRKAREDSGWIDEKAVDDHKLGELAAGVYARGYRLVKLD